MSAKREKDTRFFLSRSACANEYTQVSACLVEVRNSYLKHLYTTYAKLFKLKPFTDDALCTVSFMNSNAEFVELDESDMPNMAGLEPFMDSSERLVELPADTFDMLVKRTENNCVRGYLTLELDERGVHWELLDKHCDDVYETEKFYWEDIGIKRKPKKET